MREPKRGRLSILACLVVCALCSLTAAAAEGNRQDSPVGAWEIKTDDAAETEWWAGMFRFLMRSMTPIISTLKAARTE